MDSVSVIVAVVTVVASLGAIILVGLLLRTLVLSRKRGRVSTPASEMSWQERAAMYEASGEYADYKCPHPPRGDAGADPEARVSKR